MKQVYFSGIVSSRKKGYIFKIEYEDKEHAILYKDLFMNIMEKEGWTIQENKGYYDKKGE